MKILLSSYSGYGAWFTLRLNEEGHSVDYWLSNKKYENVLKGISPKPFFEKPNFSKYDLVLFDLTGKPKVAEEAVQQTPTIGDGNLQSQLEDDRQFGIQIMEQCGINVPPYEEFNDLNAAKRFIRKTGKRYVFKPDGGQDQETATTYVSDSAEDLLEYLDKLSATTKGVEFILQEVVSGTEVSTEAYFNGEEFYFINATLEEKKFLNENLGPNTGCAGNLVWVYNQPPHIFEQGLGKLKDFLQEYKYRGMIDLNTIVSDSQLYGLEWTPRFGYDASATVFSLISSDLGNFLGQIAAGEPADDLETLSGFAGAVRLSIPPYPSDIDGKHPEGIPIAGIEPEDAIKNCYLYDAMLDKDALVTAGASGMIAVPIDTGDTPEEAFYKVEQRIKRIKIPDMQYRTDLLKRTKKRYDILATQGWLK